MNYVIWLEFMEISQFSLPSFQKIIHFFMWFNQKTEYWVETIKKSVVSFAHSRV